MVHQQLDLKTSTAEALKARLSELEQTVNLHEEAASLQKRLLGEVKEEYDEKLKVGTWGANRNDAGLVPNGIPA